MAGVSRPDIDAVVVAHPVDHTRQGTLFSNPLGIAAAGNVIRVLGNGMTGGHTFDQAPEGRRRRMIAIAAPQFRDRLAAARQ